ncbi:MAG: hypothetical protein ACK41D_03395 [Rubricoccaceae bacterium]
MQDAFDQDAFDQDAFDPFDDNEHAFSFDAEGSFDASPPPARGHGLEAFLDEAGSPEIAARRARLTRALVHGETGVQYEALALFAEPLFMLYELDPADAFLLRTDPENAPEDVIALLETARVLWAFFSLPHAERAQRRQRLAAQLVGEDPSDEDWLSLDGLLEAAEVHWQALLPEEIAAAQQTGHDTLSFDALLQHPAFHVGAPAEDPVHAGYGPQGLSELEARALFAQPLLDDDTVMADPDAFEAALARSDLFWSLAQQGADADLDAFVAEHARSAEDAERLRGEAWQMITRYRHLFPERGA